MNNVASGFDILAPRLRRLSMAILTNSDHPEKPKKHYHSSFFYETYAGFYVLPYQSSDGESVEILGKVHKEWGWKSLAG